MSDPGDFRIEPARGRLNEARSADVLVFWADRGALSGQAARRRLPEVVCVLRNAAGEVAGVNSVFPESVPLLGARRLWVYRSLVDGSAGPEVELEMIEAAHAALAEEFAAEPHGPIGLCVLLGDRDRERFPAATVWPGAAGMLFAGYGEDGRQVRVGYFEGARV